MNFKRLAGLGMFLIFFALLVVFFIKIPVSITGAATFFLNTTPDNVFSNETNQKLTFMINNTDMSENITQVNISLPNGFLFVNSSNQTTASFTYFYNVAGLLVWTNNTVHGFISNGTT